MDNIFAICYSRGPSWVVGKSVFEQPLAAHLAYMTALKTRGTLLLGGPYTDDHGGLIVVKVPGEQAARDLIAADPAVRAGVMTATAHPWKLLAGADALAEPAPTRDG
jgi:uncharacterized protein YciI